MICWIVVVDPTTAHATSQLSSLPGVHALLDQIRRQIGHYVIANLNVSLRLNFPTTNFYGSRDSPATLSRPAVSHRPSPMWPVCRTQHR